MIYQRISNNIFVRNVRRKCYALREYRVIYQKNTSEKEKQKFLSRFL